MQLFNSFQLIALFAGMPFLLSWLSEAQFKFATAALWGGCIGYAVLFVFVWLAVYHGFSKIGW